MSKTLDKFLSFFEISVCNVLFIAMAALVILQILLRFLGLPLSWTEEVARYLFVWTVYLACGRAVKNGSHLSVDILPLILKGRAKTVLFLFGDIIVAIFLYILFKYGLVLEQKMFGTPQFSAALHLNMVIPYLAPVFGAILMGIHIIEKIIADVKELIHPGSALAVEEDAK
ncbi:hypothetical protein SDC9_62558 [bioreactor metagenome]|uniref:Tripartite ATP-independent periplasmic transporters DctQ component domain-containing protein n=1 Tax=bioreactor metagenome TaxID=1076179 RepID=A0A644XJ01_9ZZZZ